MIRFNVMLLFIGCLASVFCMSNEQLMCDHSTFKCVIPDIVKCENYLKLEEFSCATWFINQKDKTKVDYIRGVFETAATIEDECFIKNDLVVYQHRFSQFSQYSVDYEEVETFAKEGNRLAAQVLIDSDEYSNKSKETMKNVSVSANTPSLII